jgi:ABC-type transport system substrate-binding protein
MKMIKRPIAYGLVAMTVMLAACNQAAPTAAPSPAPSLAQPTEAPAASAPAQAPAPTAAPSPTTAAEPAVAPTAVPVPETPSRPYRVGIFSDLKSVNFWSYFGPNGSVWEQYVLNPTTTALYALSDQTFKIVPVVAEGLPERPLKKEGDFWIADVKMKPGVKWSDGSTLTAKDIAFTVNAAVTLKIPGSWATVYDPNFLERAEAVDDTTVRFVYKKEPGIAVHENNTLQGPILNEAYWKPIVDKVTANLSSLTAPADTASAEEKTAYNDKVTAALNELYSVDPVGEPHLGPFAFNKWEKGAFAENAANANYLQKGSVLQQYANGAFEQLDPSGQKFTAYGDPNGDKTLGYMNGPTVPATIYTVYQDQNAAVLALKNNEIDFFLNSLGLQRGLRAQLEGQDGITVFDNPNNAFRFLGFNFRREPMNDQAFRQAVATLIDKEFVARNILQGVAKTVDTYVPKDNTFWFSDKVKRWGIKDDGTGMTRQERIEAAVKLMEDAGYIWEGDKKPVWDADNQQVIAGGRLLMPNGQPMREIELIAPSAGYDPLRSTYAIWIEQWLKEFGIPVKATLLGFNNLFDRVINQQDMDMWILGWSLTIFPDYLRDFLHSEREGKGDNNSGGYSNAEFDKLADGIKTCMTYDECKQVAANVQALLSEDLPYVLLFETGITEAYRSDAIEFPYTQALGGLQFVQGIPNAVKAK